MRGDNTKMGVSVLGGVIGFVVACGVGVLATEGYTALPEGTMPMLARLLVVFGIPQLIAVGVGFRARRPGDAGAILRGGAAAAVSGFAVTCVVMALKASEPHQPQCGMAVFAAVFVFGFTTVVNGAIALVTTAIAIDVARARSPKGSMPAMTPN
jgi:hypothetical protein